jgi:hypothetical protein
MYIESMDDDGKILIKQMGSFASDYIGIEMGSIASNGGLKFKRKSDLKNPSLLSGKSRISIKGEN